MHQRDGWPACLPPDFFQGVEKSVPAMCAHLFASEVRILPVKSIADFEVLEMYFGSYYCACNLWCNSLIDCSYLEIIRLLFYHRGTFQTIPFMLFLVSCGLSWRIVRTVTNSISLESYHLHTSLVQPIPCFAWSFCEPPLQDRVFLPKPSIAIIYSIPHRATWVTSSR